MAMLGARPALVDLTGPNAKLVALLGEPVRRALEDRGTHYNVAIDSVGRVGEVLVSITGYRGHVPLCFGAEELDPGYVARVVKDTVSRFGL